MRVRFRRTIGFILLLSMILSTMPGLKLDAEAAVSSGINDMTALDALGIDISKAPWVTTQIPQKTHLARKPHP